MSCSPAWCSDTEPTICCNSGAPDATKSDGVGPVAAAQHDPVERPAHYTSHPSGVECIEITQHMGFLLGNVLKYVWRADLKGNAVQDLEKAARYLQMEIDRRKAVRR